MERRDRTLELVRQLAQSLDEEKILHCHWKSNNALDRSASGDNDLDLLVARRDEARFNRVAAELGFKQAHAPASQMMPAVLDYYGYDEGTERFVHLHVHYQLIVGHDLTKNFRIPIEEAMLETAMRGHLFPTSSPALEFIVLVLRMVLKHSTWDSILLGHGALSSSEHKEVADLEQQVDGDEVQRLLGDHLPFLSPALFDLCFEALKPRSSLLWKIRAGRHLHSALRPHARRSRSSDVALKLARRLLGGVERRLLKRIRKRRLASGGAIVAVTGGDGSGKSTLLEGLSAWLSDDFEIRTVHFGKPQWSLGTFLVRGCLRVGRSLGLAPYVSETDVLYHDDTAAREFPGYALLARLACTGRDRLLTYRRARRFVTNGGLVLADRFPFSRSDVMDGPHIRRLVPPDRVERLAETLAGLEESFYSQILWPELLIVLELDPEIAVRRKPEEPSAYVRARSQETAAIDWRSTPAHVIDASRPADEVLSTLKKLVWSEL